MRNMSFSITTPQMRAFEKDVTRRIGWLFLKPGDVVMAVEKGMGLKKGEKIKRLYPIRIVRVSGELLCQITDDEVRREGFPNMSRDEFIDMFCRAHKDCTSITSITRIEFIPLDSYWSEK